jgi:DNA-binding transcriptional ArsR family regulator
MSKGNGKHKRKNGRPKSGDELSAKLIKVKAVQADGSPTKFAEATGMTPPAALKHLRKPEVQAAVLSAREKALKAAGISRALVYGKIKEGLEAKIYSSFEGEVFESRFPDNKERRQTAETILKLFGDLEEKDQDRAPMIFNFFIPEKESIPKADSINV